MALFLVQHGKSLPKDADPEQGLSADGIAEVERIAGVAKGYGVRPLQIRHSVKKRAEQTASIFAKYLSPPKGLVETSGLKPLDDVSLVADGLRTYRGTLMLVGHLPFMKRLAGFLIAGDAELEVVRFKNAGIVCLREQDGQWSIDWVVVPDIVRE